MQPSPAQSLPYIVIRPSVLDSMVDSVGDAQLGAAVRLVHYCIHIGSAGRIPDSRSWTARQWMRLTGVDSPPATDVANLWHWEADALIVDLYDHEYLAKWLSRTASASAAASSRWKNTASATSCERITSPMQTHTENHANASIYSNNKLNTNSVHLSHLNKEERESMNNAKLSFTQWKAVMKQCHPSASRVTTDFFAKDVEDAALQAYMQLPNAVAYAQLLTAYFADTKLNERKNGVPFYRPTAQSKFFSELSDIISHAEVWAKETKWNPNPTKTNKNNEQHANKKIPPQNLASETEKAEFLEEIRELKLS